MIDSTAVVTGAPGRLGVMVRTRTSLHVYWRLRVRPDRLVLRVTELSGRPPDLALDGCGWREAAVPDGEDSVYVSGLTPGRPYAVELGERRGGRFVPLLAAPAVETPWLPAAGYREPDFPAPYFRS